MIDTYLLFNISNVLFFMGTSLLIKAVFKNRNILKGYDWLGALLTLTAMIPVEIAYVEMAYTISWEFWISFYVSLLTVAYWAFVTVYASRIRTWFHARKHFETEGCCR